MQEYKQAILLRRDLRMGCGKAAAQAAHAAVEVVLLILEQGSPEWRRWLKEWRRTGQKKIVLRVNSEEQLLRLHGQAVAAGLPAVLIADAGLTQLPPGTRTAAAIGPAPAQLVDRITGSLRLY